MKIVADTHIPFVKDYFGSQGDLILKPGRIISREDVLDADMLLVRSITHVDEKLLSGSRVRFVGSVTAGADHLDTKWLEEAGITWCVATGFNAPPVADYVLSIIAALQKNDLLLSHQVRPKVAIIGVGNVGRLVCERLAALNMDIMLCDPLRQLEDPTFPSVPLNELTDVDLISLHVPLTKTGPYPTYHFIDKAFLERQKPGCILLNASRGAVINSQDLLESGLHLEWCFDVWEHEPKIDRTVLKKALIATPHIAGYSVQSKIRGIDMIYRIACEKNIIKPLVISPITMPIQELGFAGHSHAWQDIVLGVFNPIVITAMMKTVLAHDNDGHLFDEMRNQFNYRYEFGFTTITDKKVTKADEALLNKLGLNVSPF